MGMEPVTTPPDALPRDVNPQHLLYSLLIPAIIMPLTGWMFSVSLPIIRDDFQITADLAAWVATAFSLPFMVLMPVYGRLSDGLGKRRLLLIGVAIFAGGSISATLSTNLLTLIIARIVQGLGIAGMVPLSLALITEVFPPHERGKAMGLWSTIGPITGVVGPLLAGIIVARWGWRASFIPSAIFALISLSVVYFFIPSTARKIELQFFKSFDWMGVLWLLLTFTFLLFYFSSRPITGVAPLQDWRLLVLTLLFGALFVWHERRRMDPFIRLQILKNRSLVVGSLCASLRMLVMSGSLGFVMPLYLADVLGLDPTRSGFFLMLNPAAMVVFVRFGGRLSDRLGSRAIAMTGFGIFMVVMFGISRLTAVSPPWLMVFLLIFFGVGAGFMLASLHRAALNDVAEADLGTSSGVYSMVRFLGSACGAAFGGILVQTYLESFNHIALPAYQTVFLWFTGFAFLGFVSATFLPKVNAVSLANA